MNISLTAEQKQEVFEPMFKNFETEEILEYFKEIVTKIPNAIFINQQVVLENITIHNRLVNMDN